MRAAYRSGQMQAWVVGPVGVGGTGYWKVVVFTPHTAREMVPAIGARVDLRCESLTVRCKVEDVKHVYGRARLLVRPEAGDGTQWVELSRVSLVAPTGVGQ